MHKDSKQIHAHHYAAHPCTESTAQDAPPEAGQERGAAHESHGNPQAATGPVLTVRATAGLSGDMMLAGLAALAGLGKEALVELCAELRLPALEGSITLEEHRVHGVSGWGCRITLPHEHDHRTLADVAAIIEASLMPDAAREYALRAFAILAEAEAAVHGTKPEQVTFHEVGALDSILDTCMVCRIFTLLEPARFVCSPLPLADGVIRCAHGHMPSPAPAVLRMLQGVPVCGFTGEGETVTPTALSLLKALGAEFGPWPDMVVQKTVISYGGKIFANAPNGAVWAIGAGHGGGL